MNAVLSDAPLGALWSSDFKRGSVGFVTLLPNSSLRGYFFYSLAPSVKSLIACLNGIETVRSASSYFNNIFKKNKQQRINLVVFFFVIFSPLSCLWTQRVTGHDICQLPLVPDSHHLVQTRLDGTFVSVQMWSKLDFSLVFSSQFCIFSS